MTAKTKLWMLALGVGIAAALSATPSSAGDWPQFRGPNGSGSVSDPAVPSEFGPDKNLAWKVALPGDGHGSPIVVAGKVYLQCSTKNGAERTLLCLDAKSGATLWSAAMPGKTAHTHKKNSLSSSTPAADGSGVYTLVWDGEAVHVVKYDLDGKQKWTANLGGYVSQHGPGTSPILVAGKVIVNFDQDQAAKLVALDAETGKTAWEQPRTPYRASYSVPFVMETPGKPTVVCGSTAGLSGYDPSSGQRIWNYEWKWGPKPLRAIGCPIAADGYVFLTTGDGAGDRAAIALKLGGAGELKPTAVVWQGNKSFPYVPAMLAHEGHIYFVNDRGIAACRELATGKEVWTNRVCGNVSASPILVNGLIYAADETGKICVFPAKPTFTEPKVCELGELIMATPAVSDGRLFVRAGRHLYCFAKP